MIMHFLAHDLSENRCPLFGIMRGLRPRSMAARMNFTVSASPSNTASPTRKCPILSSTISGSAAIVSARCVIEAVAGVHFEAEALGEHGAGADQLPFGFGLRGAPSISASHQAPVCSSITGAPSAAAASICARPRR